MTSWLSYCFSIQAVGSQSDGVLEGIEGDKVRYEKTELEV